ncbi:exopolysaccharide biosynthesis polyprenyl glycosylphosphotransferase [Candidatus Kaiserbacteria bacterium]|nr:exopolysaccharide biosynthesis polyprenyl glycosylphosphotransferase [Candidatus Kaiserbacteria bacterium]
MSIVPKREYLALLLGDVFTFAIALWITLALRTLSVPSWDFFATHLRPFTILFALWVLIFFMAGLYARYTRPRRARLPQLIFYTQTVNVVLAALFFFLIPYFGIAPKTILAIYLIVSSLLIFLWRIFLFPFVRPKERSKAVIIGSGDEIEELKDEVNQDERYPFMFERVLDTDHAEKHEAIQQLSRFIEEDDLSIIVADLSHPIMHSTLPFIYTAAFSKRRFAFIDIADLYEDVFERSALPLLRYGSILKNLMAPASYDVLKRSVDAVLACAIGVVSVVVYPFVALAIKIDDGGSIFVVQERIGQFQKPIRIVKFRSMSGNDGGNYGGNGKTQLKVTRVGRWLRLSRIDELPQLWNVVRGDLSFVGPRPELPALVSHYSARIPFYDARHLVKPGLTGWAQLNHHAHPHHGADVEETKNKLSYDLYYLKNRSFLLDIYIMFQTARVVLFERGS